MLKGDEEREIRQVALVDAQGNIAVHTGNRCIPAAGHLSGKNFSVQANMMVNDSVWPAMKQAYKEPAWAEIVPRLASVGLLPNDPTFLKYILDQRSEDPQ